MSKTNQTNITSDGSSDDSTTTNQDATVEKYEADKGHKDKSLIEESFGFSDFRHYAVQTFLKESVDQSDFFKKNFKWLEYYVTKN